MVSAHPVVYDNKTKKGDFKTMITDPQYKDAVFIIQENVKDGLDWDDSTGGAGTAAIRPYCWVYNQDEKPRAIGLYTGWSVAAGGFKYFNDRTEEAVDVCIDRLYLLLKKYPSIKRIIYSANASDKDLLGTGVFNPSESILRYASCRLLDLTNNNLLFADKLPNSDDLDKAISIVNRRDKNLYEWALLHDLVATSRRTPGQQSSMTSYLSRGTKRDREDSDQDDFLSMLLKK